MIVEEMQEYYRRRAAIYDQSMGYDRAEVVARQQPVIDLLCDRLDGRTVLEIACGPGFWTQFIASRALRIVATDFNEATLEEARRKRIDASRVRFERADGYALPEFEERFDAALAVDWFCHVPVNRRMAFLQGLHARLRSRPARVLICDQLPRDGLLTGRFDAGGNHLQSRELPDGTHFEVIKNFPTEEELRGMFGASDLEYHAFPEARRYVVEYLLSV